MERITILTDLRGNKNPCPLTFAFKNCNTVTVTLEMQNMVYGNCYLLFVICNTKNSFSETVNCQL